MGDALARRAAMIVRLAQGAGENVVDGPGVHLATGAQAVLEQVMSGETSSSASTGWKARVLLTCKVGNTAIPR